MEQVAFIELINNVGFPIAVSIALFYQNYKLQDSYNKTFKEFKNVINQNSESIEKLSETINSMKEGK